MPSLIGEGIPQRRIDHDRKIPFGLTRARYPFDIAGHVPAHEELLSARTECLGPRLTSDTEALGQLLRYWLFEQAFRAIRMVAGDAIAAVSFSTCTMTTVCCRSISARCRITIAKALASAAIVAAP